MKRSIFRIFFVLALALTFMLSIKPESTKAATKDNPLNNGENVVVYNGNTYFWKYNEKSFEPSTLFANYYFSKLKTANNQLISMDNNGLQTVLVESTGFGNIAIFNEHIYFEDYSNGIPQVCSVTLNGTDRQNHCKGYIMAVDSNYGLVIQDDSKTYVLDKNNVKKKIVSNGQFIAFKNGQLYYEEFNSLKSHNFNVISMNTYNKKTLLKTRGVTRNGASNTEPHIVNCQFNGDYIYLQYGFFDGSLNVFQGGEIVRVKKNGANKKILVNRKNPSLSESFQLFKQGSDMNLIYINDISTSTSLNLTTMKQKKTSLLAYEANTPFFYNDSAYMYKDTTGKKETIITKDDYIDLVNDFNPAKDQSIDVDMSCIDKIGDYVYFTADLSVRDPKNDIGWRYAYKRIKTSVYKKHLPSGTVDILYKY